MSSILPLFHTLLKEAIDAEIPDIHIKSGHRPFMRKPNGEIEEIADFQILSQEDIEYIIGEMTGEKWVKDFVANLENDFSYKFNEERFRVNIYHDSHGYSISMRHIMEKLPELIDVGIDEQLTKTLLHKEKGLILVTGPTGSGKSTTLAAMIRYINENFRKHIITIEDPIEYNFKNEKSLINQREVGSHTHSFAKAMRSALREDPDVIMVGEMRDPETIAAALTLAETGHIVLSTLHTNDSAQSIDRIIDSFPPSQQSQIRMQLSLSLNAVISQQLIPTIDNTKRIMAHEVLLNTDAVRNTILQWATHQLYSVIELSKQDGMILMDQYLLMLLQRNIISRETFLSFIRDKDLIKVI